MDMLPGLGLVYYGGRAVFRGIRKLHWMDTDRRDPGGAAARNIERDKIRRAWGGRWAKALPPLTMEERWASGDSILMGELSQAELKELNDLTFRKLVLEPSEARKQEILQAGPGGPDGHWYRGLTSQKVSDQIKAIEQIRAIYQNYANREERRVQFREKLHYMREAAKESEKAAMKNFRLNHWYQILHALNDNTMKDILERLMKILLLGSGEKDK